MKNKIGFNIVFAMLAFPIGFGLLREFDFETFKFKNIALGVIYLITFLICIFLMLKKKQEPAKDSTTDKN